MKIIVWICGAAAVLLGFTGLMFLMSDHDELDLVIGTYGENIYKYSFDDHTFEFSLKGISNAENASYALEEKGVVYAVSETGQSSGAYSFRADGMKLLSESRQTGDDPCFLLIHEGKMLTADYSGGSVSVFPVENGILGEMCQQLHFDGDGPVEARQESSHIHQLQLLPGDFDDEWILATDLGADVIHVLKCADGDVLEHAYDVECPSGSGPRHMEFSKDGKILYCIAELSGEVLVYGTDIESDGPVFRLVQRIQADEVNAGGSADIHIHPSGRWLYTSHRLDNDGIAIFNIKEDGTLEKTGYVRTARHPRNFMISPDGNLLFVACRDDKVIQVFRIEKDGSLVLTPSVLSFENDMPSSVRLCP